MQFMNCLRLPSNYRIHQMRFQRQNCSFTNGMLSRRVTCLWAAGLTDTPLPSVGQLQTLEIWGRGLVWVMALLMVLLFDLLNHLISRTSSKHRLSVLLSCYSAKRQITFSPFKAKMNPQWGYWKSPVDAPKPSEAKWHCREWHQSMK